MNSTDPQPESRPLQANAVACAEPYGASVAQEIYRQGGNAVDAAVAAAFAQCATNPLGVGIGGTGMMHIYDAASRQSIVIDGSVSIPYGAAPDIFLAGIIKGRAETTGRFPVEGNPNQYGYRSVMVPGFVRGAAEAFSGYGSGNVSWAALVEPAARLALDGFTVYPYLAEYYLYDEPSVPNALDFAGKMRAFPRAAELLTRDGRPYQCGEKIVLADMGRTLLKIGAGGADIFYTGEIGQAIAADFEQNGGFITAGDLRDYRAELRQSLRGSYRGYEILSSRPPGLGLALIEMLNILEGYDLATIGWNTPDYVELLARVQRFAFTDVSRFAMDPASGDALLEQIASKEHAEKRRVQIERGEEPAPAGGRIPQSEHTTHVTTVDKAGNAASFTHSIGSVAASCVVTPGLGFIFNNFLGQFNPTPGFANSIALGKRGGGGVPTVVLRDGEPFLAIGSSGGSRLISGVLQSIVNVIDHGMAIGEAVALPRFHSEQGKTIFAEPSIFSAVLDQVAARGYDVRRTTYMGCNQAILIDQANGRLEGGTDPRGGRGIAYWPA